MIRDSLWNVIRKPHTSEKSTIMAEKFKQFTFHVASDASKHDIKLAVENAFNVQVKNVSIVNVNGKVKRNKRGIGKRKDWKKAFVSLKENFDIDFSKTE